MTKKEQWEKIQSLIQEALNQSTHGPVDVALRNEIENLVLDIGDFVRSVLIGSETAFYGAILGQVEFNIAFNIAGPFDLDVSTATPILKINPYYLHKYNFGQFIGGIVQEIMMIPLEIPRFYKEQNSALSKEDHYLLEKATSATITSNIIEDIRHRTSGTSMVSAKSVVRPRMDAYTPAALASDIKKPLSEREAINYYYRALRDNKRSESFDAEMDSEINQQQFMGAAPTSVDATPMNGEGNMVHQYEISSESVDEMTAKFKKITANAVEASGGLDRTRGTIPGFLSEAIAKLLAPPQVKWSEHLRQMIGTIPYGKTPTRLRLNRRQPYRSDLRGHFPDRIVEVVCVFDTSGSMSAKDLETCMNEVFNITKKFRTNITVIEADMDICNIYEVQKPGDLKTDMHGRGGTCFTPAIEYINGEREFAGKKLRKGHFRNALMVYFTDGFGEHEIPRPITHKNLWVVMEDEKNLSVKEPYGKVVSIVNKNNKRR